MLRDPLTLDAGATAQDAARHLADADVRAVLVCADGRLAGVVTRKTLVREVVAEGLDPRRRPSVRSRSRRCTRSAPTPLEQAFHDLEQRDLERVPVAERTDGSPACCRARSCSGAWPRTSRTAPCGLDRIAIRLGGPALGIDAVVGFTKLLESWPVVRQFREGDPLGLGKAARSERSRTLKPRIAEADSVARSICPYCAVGCAQLVYVKDGEVIQVEGDPASPISRGRLCPKGAATKSLHAGPLREYKVKYRRPYGTRWEELPLDQAMEMIVDRDRRDARRDLAGDDAEGNPAKRTMGIANLGGATLDNEENYLIKKLLTRARRRAGREPGPHMTQLHGARSGHLVRTRRRDRLPAGPAELGLHRDHGLEHGREPPGRVPVGDGGPRARAPR